MAVVRNLPLLLALVLSRGLLVGLKRRNRVDSIRRRSDPAAVRIGNNHVGSDVEMRANGGFGGHANRASLVIVGIQNHAANGDLVAVKEGVFGRGGGDVDVGVNVVDARAVLRFDLDLRVEPSQRNHFDAPRNVSQPLQATIAVFQIAEHDVGGRLDLERRDLERGVFEHNGLRENGVGQLHDSNRQPVLQIGSVAVDVRLEEL